MNKLNHYKYIDALRGFAFLAVMTIHIGNKAPLAFLGSLTEKGQYGVQLFFLLSAVTLLRSASLRSREPSPVGNFYLRRFFRIAPLFWFGIVFYYLVHRGGTSFSAPDGVKPWHYLTTLFFVQGWTPTSINSVVPGGWSIAVEMTFYACLPFLARRITSIRAALAAAGGALAVAVLLNFFLAPVLMRAMPAGHQYLLPYFLYWWFPSQLPIFLMGFALYYCLHNETITRFLATPGRPALLALAAVVGLLALLFTDASVTSPVHVAYAVVFGMFILALAARPFRAVVNVLTCHLGVISFSCYLMHFAALTVTQRLVKPHFFAHLPPPFDSTARFAALWVATLAVTVIASTATYFAIEKPGMKLGNWLIRLRDAGRPVAPAIPAAARG